MPEQKPDHKRTHWRTLARALYATGRSYPSIRSKSLAAQAFAVICTGSLRRRCLSMFYADWHTPLQVPSKARQVASMCVLEGVRRSSKVQKKRTTNSGPPDVLNRLVSGRCACRCSAFATRNNQVQTECGYVCADAAGVTPYLYNLSTRVCSRS